MVWLTYWVIHERRVVVSGHGFQKNAASRQTDDSRPMLFQSCATIARLQSLGKLLPLVDVAFRSRLWRCLS